MFRPRHVREQVQARIHAMRVPATEELIHELYSKAMLEELDQAKKEILGLEALLGATEASHPTKGWVMFTQEQRDKIQERIQALKVHLHGY